MKTTTWTETTAVETTVETFPVALRTALAARDPFQGAHGPSYSLAHVAFLVKGLALEVRS